MLTSSVWKGGMRFESTTSANVVCTDAPTPLGKGQGATPKELVAAALTSSTGMEVIGLLKKLKETVHFLEVTANYESVKKAYPLVFDSIELVYHVEGEIDEEILIKAVRLSQSRYCAISAMLARSVPIKWRVILNNKEVSHGDAHFDDYDTDWLKSAFEG